VTTPASCIFVRASAPEFTSASTTVALRQCYFAHASRCDPRFRNLGLSHRGHAAFAETVNGHGGRRGMDDLWLFPVKWN
jgi:hypothetical protein